MGHKVGYQVNYQLSREWEGNRTQGADRYDPINVPLHIVTYCFHCPCGAELSFEIAGYAAAIKLATEQDWMINDQRCYCPPCLKRFNRIELAKQLHRDRIYEHMKLNGTLTK